MPMLRKHSYDQLNHIKKKIKKNGGDISQKLKDDYAENSLDKKIDLSDDEKLANTKTDRQLKNLPTNSIITKFENFIKN